AAKDTYRQTGRCDTGYVAFLDEERRQMSCVTNFYLTARIRAAANQSCVLRWQGAFAENAAGAFDHLLKWQVDRNQRAKHRIEMRHEHRGSHTLTRHVAEDEM